MPRHHLENPAVFGVARSWDGNAVPILLKRGETVTLAQQSLGKLSVHIRGSDGRRTDSVVEVRSEAALDYDYLLSLLENDVDNVTRRTNLTVRELRDEDLLVGLWASATGPKPAMEGFGPEFVFSGVIERPLTWAPTTSIKETAFLQFAIEGGPSVIGVCPPFASRVLLAKAALLSPSEIAAVVPTFEGDGRLADAYGWFLATGAGDAADTVGERLADQTLGSRSARPDYDSLIVAAQWCLRVGESLAMATSLSKLLEQFPGKSDAEALRLLTAFKARSEFGDYFEDRFASVLSGFRRNPPRLTATMALLVDWLIPMRAAVRRLGRWTPNDDEAFAWVRRLADALVWEVPTTAYRGLAPLEPDHDAVLPSGSNAKKKSGAGPFASS